MPIPEKETSPYGIYKGNSLLGMVTAKVSILNISSPNMQFRKAENVCPKVDFRKADAHLRDKYEVEQTRKPMSQGRLLQGRRSFKTINMKLNKPENLCSKIDFCKADAHMGRLLST